MIYLIPPMIICLCVIIFFGFLAWAFSTNWTFPDFFKEKPDKTQEILLQILEEVKKK